MKNAVLLNKKKRYINWFLRAYDLKKPEAARILDLLLNREHLLGKARFVEDVRRLPNAIIISAGDSSTVSFLCRIKGNYYENIDEIIYQLEMAPPEELFIWLSFDRSLLCDICSSVLEEHPEVRSQGFYESVVKGLETELNCIMRSREDFKSRLQAELDEALDRGDREQFLRLSSLYKQLAE